MSKHVENPNSVAGNHIARYDLHLHTCWSYDATARPENHFKRAHALGVRCITITDHHVLDSLEEVLEIAQDYPEVRVVPSAELSVTTSIGSVDLLCYGFPHPFPEELQTLLNAYHTWQRTQGEALSRGLQAMGCNFTDADRLDLLRSYRPPRTIDVQGNTHVKGAFIRRYCVERGFIDTEAGYDDLWKQARQKVHAPPYPHVADVIPVVKRAGALVAIAHPYGYFNRHDIPRMDALRTECQLDGIECAHPGVPPEYTLFYRDYCVRHGLFSTGGSDCHTDEDIQQKFAGHGGPDEWLDGFLDRLDTRRRRS